MNSNISLSFCSFLYNGVYLDKLKLSVSDVIVSQKKGSNGNGKLQFFGWDYNFTKKLNKYAQSGIQTQDLSDSISYLNLGY